MKIGLDKKTITLADVQAAKELQKEYSQYDGDTIKSLVNGACNANLSSISTAYAAFVNVEKVFDCTANVTTNRYRLTVWIECLVKVDYRTIVQIGFDGLDAMSYSKGEKVDAYIEVYKRTSADA